MLDSLRTDPGRGSVRFRPREPRIEGASFLFLVFLGLLQLVLYSPGFVFYFQGDSLYWICHRHRGFGDFLSTFWQLDGYGWFRPLAHTTIPSVFFPVFGPDPLGYHWVVFLVFLATTSLYFMFVRRLTGDWLVAALGAFLWGTHSTNVFVTYDFAFEPELFLGLFVAASCLCYVQFLHSCRRRLQLLALLFFGLALLSKEVGLSLLLVLVVLTWARGSRMGSPQSKEAEGGRVGGRLFRPLWPFFCWTVLYLLYVFFLFGMGRSGSGGPGGSYTLQLDMGTLVHLGRSLLWAVGIPSGWHTQWRQFPGFLLVALWGWVLLIGIYAILMLVRRTPEKRLVLLGLLWFVLTVTPALLVTDFKPYYLYIPMMGFSLVSAGALAWLGRRALSLGWPAAVLVVLSFLLVSLVASQRAVRQDRLFHPLLGPASTLIQQSLDDVKSAHPTLPAGATLLILDEPEDQLLWHHAGGRLFNLGYGMESLETVYSSYTGVDPEEAGDWLVFRFDSGRLVEVTEDFRRNPEAFFSEREYRYAQSGISCDLQVSPEVVEAGRDSYSLLLPEFADQTVAIQYRLNGGTPSHFRVRLNPSGRARFFVSSDTPRGRYEFLAARPEGAEEWTRCKPVTVVVEQ